VIWIYVAFGLIGGGEFGGYVYIAFGLIVGAVAARGVYALLMSVSRNEGIAPSSARCCGALPNASEGSPASPRGASEVLGSE
jgi:hypothetical protein